MGIGEGALFVIGVLVLSGLVTSLLERAGVIDAETGPARDVPQAARPEVRHSDAPYCMQCGVQMMRAGSCHACPSCGSTSGCS